MLAAANRALWPERIRQFVLRLGLLAGAGHSAAEVFGQLTDDPGPPAVREGSIGAPSAVREQARREGISDSDLDACWLNHVRAPALCDDIPEHLRPDALRGGNLNRRGGAINRNIEGGVPAGYQGHHLIPVTLAQSSDVLRRAAQLGYDINRASNGIALPATVELAIETGLPLHSGSHLGEYTRFVRVLLSELEQDWLSGAVPEGTLLEQVGAIENEVRRALLAGEVRLQANDPHG